MSKPSTDAFVDAFLIALRPGQRLWLRQVTAQGGVISKAELIACPALRPLLASDCDHCLSPQVCSTLAKRLDQLHGQGVAAQIAEATTRGDEAAARLILRDHGGAFIAMTEGQDTAQRVAEAFPEATGTSDLTLGLLRVVTALKAGDLARADVLMAETTRNFDLPRLEDCGPDQNPETVCVLFMKAVYADDPVPDAALDQLFATLRDLPADAALMRGLLYNVGLDILMRRNQMSTADEVAQRALFHYDAAGETGLGFYIHLYLVITALWQGDVARAGSARDATSAALSMYSGQTDNDAALLGSVALIQRYEAGDTDAFV